MDAVMARHFEAEAAHDRAGILATLTENAEHEPVGFPGAPFHSHDELMGFEFGPDGKPVDFRLLHVCEFEGDRISREQVWIDVNAIRFQAAVDPDENAGQLASTVVVLGARAHHEDGFREWYEPDSH